MKHVNIGDKVWFEAQWSGALESGTVIKLCHTDNNIPYAEINWTSGGTSNILLEKLYPTKKALRDVITRKSNEYVQSIKNKIHTVEDLIRFMYDTPIATGSCEYTDWDARRAVRELANELLQLNLKS